MQSSIQQKKAIPPSAHLLRGAFYAVLLVTVCAIPFILAQPNATKQRVAKLGSESKGLAGVNNAFPANIIVVTNTNDSGSGSLRDALAAANDGDTIDATGISGTILLTSGELQINHNVTINGPGAGNLAVNGNATSRVFENFAANVTISGFTMTNGFANDANGGGGILNHGGLTLTGTSILSNSAGGFFPVLGAGGGINSTAGGTLTVTNSVISGNFGGSGGGIWADGATVTVTNSTINGNVGGCNSGGGIYTNNAQLTVMNSTISSNEASGNEATPTGVCVAVAYGGGVYSSGGTLTIVNSTISANFVEAPNGAEGGGIYNTGGITMTVTNSTFDDNSATTGGSIWNGNGGAAQIGDTVLNAGMSGGTIFNSGGTITSLGYNLASDNGGGVLTGPGDQINTDPMLGPLQDNGGPTFTHALLPSSPAINAGDPSFTPPPSFDQRGSPFHRVVNGRIDIGSFEVQAGSTPTPTPRPTPIPRSRPTPAPRP